MNMIKQIPKIRLFIQIVFVALAFTGLFLTSGVFKIVTILLVLPCGLFFCGWACPFGSLQDWVGALGKKVLKKQYRSPQKAHNIAILLRYALIFAGAVGLGVLTQYDARINSLQTLAGNAVSVAALVVVGIFLIASFFIERPFCRYFCPEGAKYGIISLLRFVTIKRNPESCIDCKKCDRSCPMQIQVSLTDTDLRHPQCINCLECVVNCPVKDTLSLGLMNQPAFLQKLFPGKRTEQLDK